MKKRLTEVMELIVLLVWTGICIGGGVALGFTAMLQAIM